MKAKIPNPQAEQLAVDNWNASYPEGTVVHVRKDDGTGIRSMTRSEAWLLGGHTAVILLDGISGAYALSRCTPEVPVG